MASTAQDTVVAIWVDCSAEYYIHRSRNKDITGKKCDEK
jgi:hypothetical protein